MKNQNQKLINKQKSKKTNKKKNKNKKQKQKQKHSNIIVVISYSMHTNTIIRIVSRMTPHTQYTLIMLRIKSTTVNCQYTPQGSVL